MWHKMTRASLDSVCVPKSLLIRVNYLIINPVLILRWS
jgi:hypothetical protein